MIVISKCIMVSNYDLNPGAVAVCDIKEIFVFRLIRRDCLPVHFVAR